MKKIYLFGVLALGAISICSCTKENDVSGQGGELRTVTLRASEEGGTKVGFDKDGKFYWSKGDRIAVTTQASKTAFAELTLDEDCSGQATGTFTGTASGAPEGYAFYPADRAEGVGGDNLTFSYASVYTVQKPDETFFVTPLGTGHSFYAPMWGKIEGGSVTFKHLGGMLCLQVDNMFFSEGTVTVSSDQQLYGTYTVDLAGTEPSYVTGTDASKNTVTFNFTEAVAGKPGVFYLPLPVGDYTNVKIRVQNADDSVYSETLLGSVTISRRALVAKSVTTSYSANLPTHEGVRIYANDQTGWGAIALYQYGDKNDLGGIWPGTQVVGTENINGVTYKYFEYGTDIDIVDKKQNLIFNNNAGGIQLGDYALTFQSGVSDYFFNVTATAAMQIDPLKPDTKVTIYVEDNSGWNVDLYLYQYGDIIHYCGYWPGKKQNGTIEKDGVTYKYFEYGSAVMGKSQALIFNNGNGSQTKDYPFPFDRNTTEYYFSITSTDVTPIVK